MGDCSKYFSAEKSGRENGYLTKHCGEDYSTHQDIHSGHERDMVQEYVEHGCCPKKRAFEWTGFEGRHLPPGQHRSASECLRSVIARCMCRSLTGPKKRNVNIAALYDDVVGNICLRLSVFNGEGIRD